MLERATSRISVENCLSRSIENLRSGTLLCLANFLVSKQIMEKRGELEEWGNMKIFLKNFFVSLPKKFVGEPFRVSLISGIEKFYASEGYVTIFCRKLFVSQYRKTS